MFRGVDLINQNHKCLSPLSDSLILIRTVQLLHVVAIRTVQLLHAGCMLVACWLHAILHAKHETKAYESLRFFKSRNTVRLTELCYLLE